METKNNLPSIYPQAYLLGEYKNNTNRAILSASRESGEKLAGSLAGEAKFAQILARENEKQRKIQDLREDPDDNLRRAPTIFG